MDIVVDGDWAAAHGNDVVFADVRWYLDGRSGRAAFEAAHLPGAVFVDLDHDLSAHGAATAGRHPLPAPDHFAAAMAQLGIGDDDAVVAYDDSGGGTAGRLVWMLRVTGHRAGLLDGGLGAWPGELQTGRAATRPPASFTARPWPAAALVDADGAAAAATEPGSVVIDARSGERYRGESEPVDARPGHIPGAASAPWQGNLDAGGRFLSPEALRARFARLGITANTPVVAYCGSGVSACANLVALEHAGLAPGRLFVASWSGWAADPARPTALGPAAMGPGEGPE